MRLPRLPFRNPRIYVYRFLMGYLPSTSFMDSSLNFLFKTLGLRIGLRNFELYNMSFFPTLLKILIFSKIMIPPRYFLSISKTFTHASNDGHPPMSLRGAKRRSNLSFCCLKKRLSRLPFGKPRTMTEVQAFHSK